MRPSGTLKPSPYLEKAVAQSATAANRLALATAYKMNKEPQKALPQLEQATAAEPASYDLHMGYGRALRDQRQFIPAANQFAVSAKLKPDSKEAWNELAGVLTLAEQYPQALAALDRVRALRAEIPGDYYLRPSFSINCKITSWRSRATGNSGHERRQESGRGVQSPSTIADYRENIEQEMKLAILFLAPLLAAAQKSSGAPADDLARLQSEPNLEARARRVE